MFDWVGNWALTTPNKTALKEAETGRTLSYSEWNNQANTVVHYFSSIGLKKGDRIAILAENCLEYFILFSVCQKMGTILVPLNYRLTSAEINYLLNNASPDLLIVEDKFSQLAAATEYYSKLKHCISLTVFTAYCTPSETDLSKVQYPEAVSMDDSLFIIYTSGTTGHPKGALYTHKMLFWNSINTTLRMDNTSESRSLVCMPLFHTGGWNVIGTPFIHRGAFICVQKTFDPALTLQLMQDEKISIFMAVPTMLKILADQPDFANADLSSVEYFMVGGEALPIPLIELWDKKGIPIRQGFGMTEAGPSLTSLHQNDAIRKIGSIGTPNFYVQIKIVDENGMEVGVNETGEMLVKGDMVLPGYWNNPEASKEAFTDGWFHTGDILLKDEEGFLYVKDRKKNMFISGGENVYPAEIEKYIYTHSQIAEVAVVAMKDERWGEVGHAYVVLKENTPLTAAEIIEYCKKGLAKFKIPKAITFLNELPKNAAGKIDKKLLTRNQ